MIVIKDARICTVSHGVIEKGCCVVDEGRFVSVGTGLAYPSDCEIVDASGKWLVPGFIDCHCHVGIMPEGEDHSDENENTSAVTGSVRALDGIDFGDRGFRDAVDGGVTSIMIHPGSANVVAGTSVAVKVAGSSVSSRVLRDPAGVKVAWTPGGRGGLPSSDIPYPSTRMGIAAIVREQLALAREHLTRIESGNGQPERDPRRRYTLEVLGKVLRRMIPLRVHCMTPPDIFALLRLQDEFGFEFTVDHGDEAHLIADDLRERGIPVNYGPLMGDRWMPMFPNARPDAARLLDDAGLRVSFVTDHPVVSIRDLRLQAAICVKHGLDPDRALRMLTLNPATTMGVEGRLGSINPGKDADFTIFSGDPLRVQSRVEAVFVDGRQVK